MKKYKNLILICAAVLLFAGGWLFIWHRIGTQLDQAGYDAAFDTVEFMGAYYTACTAEDAAAYLGEELSADAESLCGSAFPEKVQIPAAGNVQCSAYHCKLLEDTGRRDGIILLERQGQKIPYLLADFVSLGETPSITEVCAAYGLQSAEDIAAVEVCDGDGTLLESITDSDARSQFYQKFAALGDALTDEETAAHYLAAYEAEYGETDALTVENGQVSAADNETYNRAMELWSTGLCLVHIRLSNGLTLRGTVYTPGAGLYTVRACYALETPFFS